jgi:protein associated with RNAse G/E
VYYLEMADPRASVAASGSHALLRATKYDGSAHWIQPFRVRSDDGNLLVAEYRARTPIFTSRGEFRSPYDSTVYFWRDRWFNVFRLARPGCELALWYCNVTTPPVFVDGQINYVDLDLDVAVRPDGAIELLDEDEFQAHREKYHYPTDVVAEARQAAAEVSRLARDGRFPFDKG